MTEKNNTADVSKRLTELAERVRRVAVGETDAHLDNLLAETAEGWDDPWRYDMQTERLQIVLEEGLQLVEEMQTLQYARLSQEVRDADAERYAAARSWRAAA